MPRTEVRGRWFSGCLSVMPGAGDVQASLDGAWGNPIETVYFLSNKKHSKNQRPQRAFMAALEPTHPVPIMPTEIFTVPSFSYEVSDSVL